MSEVNPRPRPHLLVNLKRLTSVEIVYRVKRVFYAFGECLIRNIHSIQSVFGHIHAPRCTRGVLVVLGGFHLAECSFNKWILIVDVIVAFPRKTHAVACSPFFIAVFFCVSCLRLAAIAVNHHLEAVYVAVARAHHVCAGIFKHRHEERNHIRLRVKVLYRLVETRTLPFPSVELWLEVPAMALPQCYHVAAQAILIVFGCRYGCHKGFIVATRIFLIEVHHVVGYVVAFYAQLHIVFRITLAGYCLYSILQLLYGCRRKWHVAIGFVQRHLQGFILFVDLHRCHRNRSDAHVCRNGAAKQLGCLCQLHFAESLSRCKIAHLKCTKYGKNAK